jgi:uncharacterized OB-fold protein
VSKPTRARLPIPPAAINPDNAEHFRALEEGKLLLPRCDRCSEVFWYPRHHCPVCGGNSVSWLTASGQGLIYSFTIVRKGPGPYTEIGPYVLAYVELDEGVRVLSNITDVADIQALEIGMPVEAVFDREPETAVLLRFRPL